MAKNVANRRQRGKGPFPDSPTGRTHKGRTDFSSQEGVPNPVMPESPTPIVPRGPIQPVMPKESPTPVVPRGPIQPVMPKESPTPIIPETPTGFTGKAVYDAQGRSNFPSAPVSVSLNSPSNTSRSSEGPSEGRVVIPRGQQPNRFGEGGTVMPQGESPNRYGEGGTRGFLPAQPTGSDGLTPPEPAVPEPASPASPTTPVTPTMPLGGDPRIVPGSPDPNDPSQVNIVDWSSQVANDPSLAITPEMQLSGNVPQQTREDVAAGIVQTQNMGPSSRSTASLDNLEAQQGVAQQNPGASGYSAYRASDNVTQMQGQTGVLSDGSLANTDDLGTDTEAIAQGQSPLSDSFTKSAQQAFGVKSTQGAKNLGLTNQEYVDKQATVKGQIEELQKEFVDENGDPKIPVWAAASARNVSKMATFSGMTGTAATAAMSQAIMEASVSIAQQDAQFFQTLTVKNLDNAQQATINNANILAKLEGQNVDARTAAAIQNSKNFLDMDLANLSNEQQAEVINQQSRMQALLETSNQVNLAKRFNAEQDNDFSKFYSNLQQDMSQFNASQSNELNVARTQMEQQRDQFYSNMRQETQLANARWRQSLVTSDREMEFEAAAIDARNLLDIQTAQLAEIWDRSDAMLDFVWQSGENEADRNRDILLQQMAADANLDIAEFQADQQSGQALGGIFGSIAGTAAESFFSGFDWGGLF